MHLETIWRSTGTIAAALFTASVTGFALALPGYQHLLHPVALLGAPGIPNANAFNLFGFLLPGLLAAVLATYLMTRPMQHPSWSLRIGIQLVMLSGLAFAAMGILPLDIGELEERTTQYHATVWLLWGIAFCTATALLTFALLSRPGVVMLTWATCIAGLIVAASSFGPAERLHPGLAQRIGFAAWLLWLMLAGWRWPTSSP
ncbi:DUF998 domain-containing protein [Xylella fastidiosa subsp. multiplex]|uniref:DUF998 domain-containing protein n=1 Tax=Xylella fastidiosa TaxID=2371 RepID=UPI0012B3B895|nr:DUF998 domain-containing protein [Xylella fastidiosa]MSS79237.1 DUF998 domain-containing protein [Xylella fastidiosa subsp. multiplex]